MTKEQIRKDLKEIKYYYENKKSIDNADNEINLRDLKMKVMLYNKAVRKLDIKLINLYNLVYIQGKSVKEVTNEWNFSYEYMRKLHAKLVKGFIKSIRSGVSYF